MGPGEGVVGGKGGGELGAGEGVFRLVWLRSAARPEELPSVNVPTDPRRRV